MRGARGGRALTYKEQNPRNFTQVLSGDDERVATWRQLAPNWQDLWLRWDGQRGERKDEGQAGVDEAERLAFVRSLVAQVCNIRCVLAQPNYKFQRKAVVINLIMFLGVPSGSSCWTCSRWKSILHLAGGMHECSLNFSCERGSD